MDKVVHFEIPADDIERAQKFYSAVFGWEISNIPEMNYTILKTVKTDENQMPKESGAINGGMMKRIAGEGPIIVINVASINDSMEKIKKEGGAVVLPLQKIGEMGLYARVADTEGNVIGLWQDIK